MADFGTWSSSASGSSARRSGERSHLLSIAPHLVRIEPLLFPIYGIPFASKAFYDAGLTLYDILGARHDGGWHERLSRAATLELAPTLRKDGLRGGLLYHDGVEDDARYTLAVARTAIAAGGLAVTRVRATGIRPSSSGAIEALRATDLTTDAEMEIATAAVVDATGVWAAEPGHPFGGGSIRILPSRGAHLVVPRARIPNQIGLTIRVPGKIVFLVPWPDHWLIGTTDAPFEGPAARPSAAGWEVDKLLDTVNATMDVNLTRADVVGTFAGLRPLIAPSDGSTVKASREHRITVGSNGVVRIGGGKYTTYRVMARDVIDAVLGPAEAKARPSDTAERRLVGAAEPDALSRIVDEIATIPAVAAASPDAALRLVDRHGTEAPARGRAGRRARPDPPARRRAPVPRGGGRLGRAPRARPFDRRRARPPHAPCAGAARSRRRGRPAGRGDPRRRSLAGAPRARCSRSRCTSPRRGASSR